MERLQHKFYKWTLRLDMSTPDHVVRTEMDLTKVRAVAGKRAIKYETSLREIEAKKLGRACLEDIKTRRQLGKKMGKWEVKRVEYYRRQGYAE